METPQKGWKRGKKEAAAEDAWATQAVAKRRKNTRAEIIAEEEDDPEVIEVSDAEIAPHAESSQSAAHLQARRDYGWRRIAAQQEQVEVIGAVAAELRLMRKAQMKQAEDNSQLLLRIAEGMDGLLLHFGRQELERREQGVGTEPEQSGAEVEGSDESEEEPEEPETGVGKGKGKEKETEGPEETEGAEETEGREEAELL